MNATDELKDKVYIVTGASKGFGFVEMPKPGEAKAAIKSLNNHALGDANIRVKKAEDKPETK